MSVCPYLIRQTSPETLPRRFAGGNNILNIVHREAYVTGLLDCVALILRGKDHGVIE